MKKTNKKTKVIIVLSIFFIVSIILNSVYARITSPSGGVQTGAMSPSSAGDNRLYDIITDVAASALFSGIGTLIAGLAVALFMTLQTIFGAATGSFLDVAMPDTVVLNRMAFFDPNFINPATGSIIDPIHTIVKNLYASFYTIAMSVFIISAMVVGLKLAISSIAAKKAQYKEASMKWITGILILFFLKWIMALIFYVNELLVSKISAECVNISIPVEILDALNIVPMFGALIKNLTEFVAGGPVEIHVHGYSGLILSSVVEGIGGNLIGAVISLILLGQTFTIFFSYLRRVIVCLFLGLISPLVVAVDTITSSSGKKATLFMNWLKNFATTVFIQSIHAMYMLVALAIIEEMYQTSSMNSSQRSLIVIALTTGLVKLEKIIKSMFGIGESLAGDLKDGSKGMSRALGMLKDLGAGLKAGSDNGAKQKAAGKRRAAYQAELSQLRGISKGSSGGNVTINNNNTSQSTSTTNNGSGHNYLDEVINKHSRPSSNEEKIAMLQGAIAQERAKENAARIAKYLSPINAIAGLGLGLGIGDSSIGKDISKGLNRVTEGIVSKATHAGINSKSNDAESGSSSSGHANNKGNSSTLYVNPIAVDKEMKKQFSQAGEEFGEAAKRKLKQIDKNLDNN